jgi:hypothetical protein
MKGKLAMAALLTVWLELGAGSSRALGDGGTLRFSGRRDDRMITVLTTPAPLEVGPADLSVLVQQAETGTPITELPIDVIARRTGHQEAAIRASATTEAATNKLMRAARLDLLEPGRWHIDVVVAGVDPAQPIGFDVDVAPPPPPWMQMILWIAWPIIPIGLFALKEFRTKRV